VLSLITRLSDGSAIEVSTVGNQGMAVVSAFLDPAAPANADTICQVPGQVYVIPADTFRESVDALPDLRRQCLRYAAALLTQVGQAVACSRLHPSGQRCARWLLMTHARVRADDIPLTHDFLAFMLGVRRASVTNALATLAADGLIATRRGSIRILDREGLGDASCECYVTMEQAFDAVLRTRP
jgi:CRP-like cAMP-binding protein